MKRTSPRRRPSRWTNSSPRCGRSSRSAGGPISRRLGASNCRESPHLLPDPRDPGDRTKGGPPSTLHNQRRAEVIVSGSIDPRESRALRKTLLGIDDFVLERRLLSRIMRRALRPAFNTMRSLAGQSKKSGRFQKSIVTTTIFNGKRSTEVVGARLGPRLCDRAAYTMPTSWNSGPAEGHDPRTGRLPIRAGTELSGCPLSTIQEPGPVPSSPRRTRNTRKPYRPGS